MTLKQGDTLVKGKYQVERLIGKGGCGEVYLARHAALGKQYALKVLPKGVDHSWYEEVKERFQREAKLGAYIKDKHLIEVYDMEEDEEVGLLMRMEYAPGGSLRDVLEKNRAEGKRMSVGEALEILLQTAEGLEALHAEDVIHRDVKPSNILIGEGSVVKVSDLGLAQIPYGDSRDLMSNPPPHPGTPMYMSPEQANPPYQTLTPASDTYALGMVLFEMLTGRVYKTQPPEKRRLGAWREDLRPGWVEVLFQEMLAKEPEERPWDGKALAERLRAGMAQDAQEKQKQEAAEQRAVEERERQIRLKEEEEEKTRQAAIVREEAAEQERLRKQEEERQRREAEEKGRREKQAREEARRTRQVAAEGQGLRQWWVGLGLGGILGVGVMGLVLGVILMQVLKPGTGTATGTPKPEKGETVEVLAKPTEGEAIKSTEMVKGIEITQTKPAEPTVAVNGDTRKSDMDGMEQVWVPAGSFLMGSLSSDSDAGGDEKPQHTVTLAGYWIDKYEVTNGQYAMCEKEGKCEKPSSSQYDDQKYVDHPVVNVDWEMAKAYCGWAERRLPTEAEWEKAARGMDGRKYPWGDEAASCEKVNYWGKDGDCIGDTTKVGSYDKGASPYGAMDMAGNVWEWVSSLKESYPYNASDGRENLSVGGSRVLRGGSWGYGERFVRTANRDGGDPTGRGNSLGFRCASPQ